MKKVYDNSESLERAYSKALVFTKSHYENFPVVSHFLPSKIRKHTAIIYQFARTADDFADEGILSSDERLTYLSDYENKLAECLIGNYENDFWYALRNTIEENNLSPIHFYDLLKAFKQDVVIKRYADFNELLGYCRFSANPVGRLILELYNIRDEESKIYSDNICTALQLTNFYQDIPLDFKKGRIYLPHDEMEIYGVSEKILELKENNVNLRTFLNFQIERTRTLFNTGRKLISRLPWKLKFQISWTILGGEKILEKIEKINYDVLNIRPRLSRKNFLELITASISIVKK